MKEDFYKAVIQKSPIGYACNKIICDETGTPCDYEYIDMNSAFAGFLGFKEEELTGRRFSEVFPLLYQAKPGWFKTFGEIALSGGETELELYSEVLGGWFRIKVYSPEQHYFILYIIDTSKENEQSDELKNLTEIVEKTEFKYKSISEEKGTWERRLHEIADVFRLENDQQFQRIIENLPFSLDIVSLDGVIMYANTKCLDLFELDESVAGRRKILDFWVDEGRKDHWFQLLKEKGVVNDFEMHLRTAKGREFWAIGSGIIIQYQERSCILSTMIDISERKSMESALKLSEEKYRLMTEFTSDVIWILDLDKQKYTYVSPSILQLTGYTPEEIMGMDLAGSLTPESVIIVQEAIETHLQEFKTNPDSQKSYILEIRQKCKNGDVIWVEISSKYRFNEAGDIEIVGVSRNIEERKKTEREVLYLSYHDQLTGLYNRRFYVEELKRINFRSNLPLTMVIADVNGLKLTNDAFGHFSGDDLLQKFTNILNQELRAEDVAARIGGDEFVLLLPKTDSAETEALIGRIKERIRRSESENSVLSVSFGWAVKETVEEDFGVLFTHAEDNMYHTKLVESTNMKNETIQLAMRKLYQKDAMEQLHAERVGRLCREIGKAMDLQESDLLELELLGRMHDIGKIGIQDEILGKLNQLDDAEWLEIKRHPEVGYQILRSADEYVHIAEAVLSHHERADGKGYPRNLKMEDIPLPARILAIAEAYDTMTQGSRYKASAGETDAVKELVDHSGTQFDGEIVKIFIDKVLRMTGKAN